MTPRLPPFSAVIVALVALGSACHGASPDDPLQAEIDRIVAKDCEILAACECAHNPYSDPEFCDDMVRSDLAGQVAGAREAGLTVDVECLEARSWGSYAGCRLQDEIQAMSTSLVRPERCGDCQVAYGELEVGERCTRYYNYFSISNCAEGLACIDVDGEPRCIDPCASVVGSPCFWDTCGAEMYCDDEGRCARAGAIGEPCAGNTCASGLWCSQGSQTCIEIADEGEPCTTNSDCEEALFCDVEVGRCVVDFDPGAACDDVGQCRDGYCMDGICVPDPGVGEPCRSSSCGEGATCQQALGICVVAEPLICEDW